MINPRLVAMAFLVQGSGNGDRQFIKQVIQSPYRAAEISGFNPGFASERFCVGGQAAVGTELPAGRDRDVTVGASFKVLDADTDADIGPRRGTADRRADVSCAQQA